VDERSDVDDARLAAEQRARVLIDRQLSDAGWLVQDRREMNLFAGPGIAVREVVMAPGHGREDYLLYVDRRVVGVIVAKPEGTPLSGVEWQSAMYATGLPEGPFVFEASGSETHLTNGLDPVPRARRLPAAGDARPVAARRRGRSAAPDLAGEGAIDASTADRGTAAGADRGDPRHRGVARLGAARPLARADGHRRRQDLHRGLAVLPAAQAREGLREPLIRVARGQVALVVTHRAARGAQQPRQLCGLPLAVALAVRHERRAARIDLMASHRASSPDPRPRLRQTGRTERSGVCFGPVSVHGARALWPNTAS
jgi:hypothetical protein